jgi:hypothetical protein
MSEIFNFAPLKKVVRASDLANCCSLFRPAPSFSLGTLAAFRSVAAACDGGVLL